jgi:hypothetical protein
MMRNGEVRKSVHRELCELWTVIMELDRVLSAKSAKGTDLPPLPPTRRMN